MRTLRQIVILSLVVLVAVFLAAPSAMAKKQLTENELDMVTAAGEPMVINGGLIGSITYTDGSTFSMTLPTGAQTGLQALTLNNVVGELQLANAFNVQSAVQDLSGGQTNTITQSWGATKDLTASFATVAGVTAAAGNGGNGGDSEASSGCGTGSGTAKCAGNVAKASAGGDGGAGGAGSTSPGKIAGAVTSQYGDVIITGGGVSGSIYVDVDPVFAMTLDTTSQSNLLALVVNNIVGMSQVANATNISGAGVTLVPLAIGPTSSNGRAAQANTINQFRGTPYSRPLAPVVFSP